MKKQYKALMLDMDGTTIPNHAGGMPSERVKKAVQEANKYLHVGAVTARPIFMVEKIFEELKLTGPSIINGGAQVIDSQTRKILYQQLIDSAVIKELLGILSPLSKKYDLKLLINDDNEDITDVENYRPKKPLNLYVTNVKKTSADKLVDSLSHIPDIAIHKIPSFTTGEVWVEINHAASTKQHGIFEAAKILGIDTHEIIGVGDGYNDFPLLMACGLKVAMGNAVPELKAIADYIAPTVEEDGVADVIEKFVL